MEHITLGKKLLVTLAVLASCGALLLLAYFSRPADSYQPGAWTENTYTSDFMSLQLTLPTGWKPIGEAEIASAQALLGTDDSAGFYEMWAANEKSGESMLIILQKNTKKAAKVAEIYAQQYANSSTDLQPVESLRTGLQTLSGKEYEGVRVSVPSTGAEQLIFTRNVDKSYIMTLHVVGKIGSTQPLLDCFH
ncbi:MAG: hypothetical protein RRY65_06945 [Pseudoflavonifractor sp.]